MFAPAILPWPPSPPLLNDCFVPVQNTAEPNCTGCCQPLVGVRQRAADAGGAGRLWQCAVPVPFAAPAALRPQPTDAAAGGGSVCVVAGRRRGGRLFSHPHRATG